MRVRCRPFVPVLFGALCALATPLGAQEPVTITGRVTSDAGAPLGSVEVSIAAMSVGTLTRDDGRYAFVIPGARVSRQTVTLTARRLGYKAQSAQITLAAGGVTHDFTLASNPLQLGEVVVTGAGTTTAIEKLGNVRNAVSAEQIDKSNETNIVEALAAKAPNVQVTGQSGDPVSGPSRIRLSEVPAAVAPSVATEVSEMRKHEKGERARDDRIRVDLMELAQNLEAVAPMEGMRTRFNFRGNESQSRAATCQPRAANPFRFRKSLRSSPRLEKNPGLPGRPSKVGYRPPGRQW